MNNILNICNTYYQYAQQGAQSYYTTQHVKDNLIDISYTGAKVNYIATKIKSLSAGEVAPILDFSKIPSLNYQSISKYLSSTIDFHTEFCNNQELECLFKLGRHVTYDLPNASPSVFSWGTAKISQVSISCLDYLAKTYESINDFRNGSVFSTVSSFAQKGYDILDYLGNELVSKSTTLILGKTPLNLEGQTPFKAIDLILPAIFQHYCLNKTKENLKEFLFHLKLLVTMKREYTTAYACGRKFGHGPITNNEEYYTGKQLVQYAAKDFLCTSLWGSLSFVSIYKIYDVIAQASGSQERAFIIASTLALTNIALPILFQGSPITYLDPSKTLQSFIKEDDENPAPRRQHLPTLNTERVQVKTSENGNVIIEIAK
jgi:hypothetical protein